MFVPSCCSNANRRAGLEVMRQAQVAGIGRCISSGTSCPVEERKPELAEREGMNEGDGER